MQWFWSKRGGGCKKNKLTIGVCAIAVLLSFAAPALADTPTPTLDAIKATQSAYLTGTHPSYTLTKIIEDATAPEDSITVKIDGTSYYYTPSDNTEVLQSLASTGSVALEVTTDPSKALYSVGDTYYTYNSDKLKGSSYNLTEAASADEPNTITLYDKNDDGTVTPKYYTVNLNQTVYGDAAASGAVAHYYKWTNDSTGVKLESTSDAAQANITYWEDPSKTAASRITSDQSGADINNNFIGLGAGGGGAIYNADEIGNITGDFIDNHTYKRDTYGNAMGGAIYNDDDAEIGDITGDFIGNHASYDGASAARGGAIYGGTIENITGDFIGNYASGANNANAVGGAISGATIGNITGDFIGNYASSTDSSAEGGAISGATIGNITGDFIGNYAFSTANYNSAYGGAIYHNGGTIENITGDFIGNYAFSTDSYARGGAIYNWETIGDITGDFIGNYLSSNDSYVHGGAIYNWETIGDITGDFIGNYVSGVSNILDATSGGAIYNNYESTIENITGDFIGNYASSADGIVYGGAIYNRGTIEDITGDFIDNHAQSNNSYAFGGAIYNYISNSSHTATIGLTNNNFLNNYAKSETGTAKGGAIFTNYDLTLNADNGNVLISGNYTESNGVKENNAIYVANRANGEGVIERSTTFTLNAINNGKIQIDDTIAGGSYYISWVYPLPPYTSPAFWETSDHAYTLALTGDGTGTISLYNDIKNANVTSENVTVDFANGETRDYNFVSMTAGEDTKLNLDVDFSNKTADTISTQNASTGTLIINAINELGSADGAVTVQIIKNTDPSSSLQLALGDNFTEVAQDFVFDKNYVEHTDKFVQEGGLALATTDTTNDSITIVQEKLFDTLQLINSYATDEDRTFQFADSSKYTLSEDLNPTTAGVLNINGVSASAPSTLDANSHTLFDLQNETTLNISNVSIEGAKDYAIKAENANSVVNLTNASFKNTDGTAINSNVDINITANAGKSEFSGNTSAIQMNDATKSINLRAVNKGEIVLSDVVDGVQGYSLKLDGDNKSKITVNNNVNNAIIHLDNTNVYLGRDDVFNQSQALSLNSGAIYLNNNAIGTMHVPTLNLNGTTNLSVDVDLQNEVMDRVTADTYNVKEGAMLNVNYLNLLSTTDKSSVKILFADELLANNVEYTGDSPVSYKGTNTVYSPIYKYNVQYGVDSEDKLGYFFFNRAASGSGSNGNISDAFNPAVLASPVAQQAGAYTTQLQAFNYAFQHADTFMNIPYLERISMINAGKYAMSPTGDATDVGTFSPLLTKEEDAGFWVKPYASFENVPLKNGPKVSNINYGTLIGYDSALTSVSHGFERVLTGYIGYNGASQRYQGVDAYQNGGLIGGTATFYKGNFFNATTLSVGATAGDASTMYGSENYTMLLAGIGNKTGYNFEFWDGKMILQPNFLISYTFVNTFDYNNAAGVRIESDPLHAIQLSPGLKLIGNTKNGWQPYIGVNMVWNLLDDSRVTANDVRLPEMSIRPYVQYGVGVQKRFKDKFLAFGQAMIHNGGRNGVSLTVGLRWKVGRE